MTRQAEVYDAILEALRTLDRARLRRVAFEALRISDGPEADPQKKAEVGNTQAAKQSDVKVTNYSIQNGRLHFHILGKEFPEKELFNRPRGRT